MSASASRRYVRLHTLPKTGTARDFPRAAAVIALEAADAAQRVYLPVQCESRAREWERRLYRGRYRALCKMRAKGVAAGSSRARTAKSRNAARGALTGARRCVCWRVMREAGHAQCASTARVEAAAPQSYKRLRLIRARPRRRYARKADAEVWAGAQKMLLRHHRGDEAACILCRNCLPIMMPAVDCRLPA